MKVITAPAFYNTGSTYKTRVAQPVSFNDQSITNVDDITVSGTVINPSAAKAWCRIAAAGTIVSGSFNVASITDTATGNRTINWDTDFSDANYTLLNEVAAGVFNFILSDSFATGSVRVNVYDTNESTKEDSATSSVAFGAQ